MICGLDNLTSCSGRASKLRSVDIPCSAGPDIENVKRGTSKTRRAGSGAASSGVRRSVV